MKELLKQTIEELLRVMNFEGKVILEDNNSDVLRVNIETEEAPFLIGQGGQNLVCLQQIVRKIVEKKSDQPVSFILDVNNYRRYKTEVLKEIAQKTAEKVLSEGRAVIMQPMNAFERKVIHTVMANYQSLATISEGEEPNRRVIVKRQNII